VHASQAPSVILAQARSRCPSLAPMLLSAIKWSGDNPLADEGMERSQHPGTKDELPGGEQCKQPRSLAPGQLMGSRPGWSGRRPQTLEGSGSSRHTLYRLARPRESGNQRCEWNGAASLAEMACRREL
jgi:hypothetical protein